MPIAYWSTVQASIVELVLERSAQERATRRPATRQRAAAEALAAADARLAAVPGVGEAGSSAVTAALAREALVLIARAEATADGSADAPLSAAAVAAKVREACGAARAHPPPQWERAARALEAVDPLALERERTEQLAVTATALVDVARWLRSRVDVRAPDEIRWAARLRVAALLLAASAIPGFAIRNALRLPNLALDKPVTMSSLQYRSAPASALVDGHLSSRWTSRQSYGQLDFVQTNTERAPSATIDLGEVHAIREIRVYNRSDGYYDEGLPYVVELSADGKTFHAIDERNSHFGSTLFDPPWKIRAHGEPARYVRVRCQVYLALAEVEVFGR